MPKHSNPVTQTSKQNIKSSTVTIGGSLIVKCKTTNHCSVPSRKLSKLMKSRKRRKKLQQNKEMRRQKLIRKQAQSVMTNICDATQGMTDRLKVYEYLFWNDYITKQQCTRWKKKMKKRTDQNYLVWKHLESLYDAKLLRKKDLYKLLDVVRSGFEGVFESEGDDNESDGGDLSGDDLDLHNNDSEKIPTSILSSFWEKKKKEIEKEERRWDSA